MVAQGLLHLCGALSFHSQIVDLFGVKEFFPFFLLHTYISYLF